MKCCPSLSEHVLLCLSASRTHQALFARSVRGEGARVRESLSAMLAVEGLFSSVDALMFLQKNLTFSTAKVAFSTTKVA